MYGSVLSDIPIWRHNACRIAPPKSVRQAFTLVELVVAMAIFSLMMMVLINIFTSSQRVWSTTAARNEMFENARIALDIMSRDLQVAFYGNTPQTGTWGTPDWVNAQRVKIATSNSELTFLANTSLPQDNTSTTPNPPYYLKYSRNSDGWLRRAAFSIWNKTTLDTGAYDKLQIWDDGNGFDNGTNTALNTFYDITDDSVTGYMEADDMNNLIPYVTSLEFLCFNDENLPFYNEFPYAVMIRLSLLDGVSWMKYQAIGEATAAGIEFRQNNERTFTKFVLIGDRGQYR